MDLASDHEFIYVEDSDSDVAILGETNRDDLTSEDEGIEEGLDQFEDGLGNPLSAQY